MKASRAESPQAAGTKPRLRQRAWSEAQAREILAEQQRSGQWMTTFARERGFSVKRLSWWKHQLATRDLAVRASAPAFLPVRVVSSEPRASAPSAPSPRAESASLEVVVGAGRVIRVRSDFDPSLLTRLVRTLERDVEGAC